MKIKVKSNNQTMNNNPLVTVAIPVYNAERFLPSGLDSLWSQTYQNFEILLADDGSTDATPSLCDEIAAKDGRVRVLHYQHQGVGAMRNALVENAKGDYLYFFDIDDQIEPELLERNVEAMEEGGYDMIFFGFEVVNQQLNLKDQVRMSRHTVQTNDESVQVQTQAGTGSESNLTCKIGVVNNAVAEVYCQILLVGLFT